MDNERRVAVVGAVNVDLCGTPSTAYLPGDSNPGCVRLGMGGVGRNIAENLRRLGYAVELVTALGDDANALSVRRSCQELGIGLSHSLAVPGARTGAYLCLNDERGELVGAVSDMGICEALTPEALQKRLDMLNRCALVVLDANLPQRTLTYLSQNLTVPVFADPVSVKKARRLSGALAGLTAVKPNIPEAECLSEVAIRGDGDLPRAAQRLHALGVRLVFISLGGRGAYYDDGHTRGLCPCVPGTVVNTTGCGDAFMAGAAHAWLSGAGAVQTAQTGLAAASLCAASDQSVNPLISREALAPWIRSEGGAL